MDPDRYRNAKLRYAHTRRGAYAVVLSDAAILQLNAPAIRLADIDARALAAWERTWKMPHRSGSGGWNWRNLVEEFRSDPAALKTALWSGDVLCGMALGRPSHRTATRNRERLSVHYMEGNPDPAHPLKRRVAPLLLTVAEVYGRDLGASAIRLIDPLPGVLPVYVQLGFAVVRTSSGIVYCEKEVSR